MNAGLLNLINSIITKPLSEQNCFLEFEKHFYWEKYFYFKNFPMFVINSYFHFQSLPKVLHMYSYYLIIVSIQVAFSFIALRNIIALLDNIANYSHSLQNYHAILVATFAYRTVMNHDNLDISLTNFIS